MTKNSEKPTKYWFKRRRYGWGWMPVTREGWIVVIGSLAVILVAAFSLPKKPEQPSVEQLGLFFGAVVLAIIGLLIASFAKGPAPHWRWGKKPSDNPNEDF